MHLILMLNHDLFFMQVFVNLHLFYIFNILQLIILTNLIIFYQSLHIQINLQVIDFLNHLF
jgi:hypothetical protein